MTFAFDEQFAMFDITPVENQFILEYLPGAKGEYVKVYLYGLLSCYHPKQDMGISTMSRELGMTEEEIMQAFRYWERKGIVRRTQDHPPCWQFINIKQKNLVGDDTPDPDYVQFTREMERCFEGVREFHGSEAAACYEWKESMGLPTEVILMLLNHMKNTRGKSFKIKDAEKVAMILSDEKAYTIEDAEQILARDGAMNTGFRSVLRKLGMRFNPSEANLKLYRKWTDEWHFTQDAIEAACDRTGTSTPSLALVDSILEKTWQAFGSKRELLDRTALDAYEQQRTGLKQILAEIGYHGIPTPIQQKTYIQMTELYPQSIILLAAKECAAKRSSFDSVLKLLQSWKKRGFIGEEQILDHIKAFHSKDNYLRSLRQKWSGRNDDPGQKAFQLLDKWENELGFSRDMITLAADYAFEARKPVSYMDSILSGWAEKGIRTAEEAAKEKREGGTLASAQERKPSERKVSAQQYQQRDYSHEQEEAMQRMLNLDGGENHA